MHMSTKTGAALVLALALGASALPAQAASFSFGFGFGNDGVYQGRSIICLTERALRRAIGAEGYKNIYLNNEYEHRMQIRATRGKWVYLLQVNSCTGRILDRERLRPA